MKEIYEAYYQDCGYCERSYYEWDTGFAEYVCTLCDTDCFGGSIESGCPLSFKYEITE